MRAAGGTDSMLAGGELGPRSASGKILVIAQTAKESNVAQAAIMTSHPPGPIPEHQVNPAISLTSVTLGRGFFRPTSPASTANVEFCARQR
jgi:hypothetical protein